MKKAGYMQAGLCGLFIILALLTGCPTGGESPKSSNANLASLTVSDGILSPAFAASTTAYTVSVPNATTSITVTGIAADPAAAVTAPLTLGGLVVGVAQTATITVTAQGGSKKDYLVRVNRAGPDDSISAALGILKSVPAGRFQRDGTTADISEISKPFLMSQHEISRAQFNAVMGADPSNMSYSGGTSDPVQNVNWYQAIAFCNKLSIQEGLTPAYSVKVGGSELAWASLSFAAIPTVDNADWNASVCDWNASGYRLPTEMEWMWAAMGAPSDGRGSGTNTTGYLKPFAGSPGSGQIDDYAWHRGNSAETSHPVGAKLANELGIYDMSGNVSEWCWDRHAFAYDEGPLKDYRGAPSGSDRVLRGGGLNDYASDCTVAFRQHAGPSEHSYHLGFRVLRP